MELLEVPEVPRVVRAGNMIEELVRKSDLIDLIEVLEGGVALSLCMLDSQAKVILRLIFALRRRKGGQIPDGLP
jgi:hypothetical protein